MQKKIAIFAAALFCALTSANAEIINDTAFNGTYTVDTDASLSFSPFEGISYGFSAQVELNNFDTDPGNDKTASLISLTIGAPLFEPNGKVGINSNVYTHKEFGGLPTGNLFVNPIRVNFPSPINVDLGENKPIYIGVGLVATGDSWTVNYYYGGTGFDANGNYQGGTLIGSNTGITYADLGDDIYLRFLKADSKTSKSVISNFKLVAVSGLSGVPTPAKK